MSHADHTQTIIYVIFLLVLITFVTVGSWMESKHLPWGHETGFIILFGMLISYVTSRISEEAEHDLTFPFDTEIFFDLALPCILFAAGFNMRRKQFFANFINIAKFGIFGSLFTFVIFSVLTWLLFEYCDMSVWNPKT